MRRKLVLITALVAVLAAIGGGAAFAGGGDDDATDTAITGSDLRRASQAALQHTGGGSVTETEVGDEESLYEVEVTLDGGRQVDVQLDKGFNVVGSENDGDKQGDD